MCIITIILFVPFCCLTNAFTTPTLIKKAVNLPECKSWCSNFIKSSSHLTIDYQIQQPSDTIAATSTLDDFITRAMYQSTPKRAFYFFHEGLLDQPPPPSHGAFSERRSWFDHFPGDAKPTDALVIAGQGSRSTLHRDPFDWIGTSVLLEGAKIWRFIIPHDSTPLDDLGDSLNSYRLPSAWNDQNLSFGTQSDLTLFDIPNSHIPPVAEIVVHGTRDSRERYYNDHILLPPPSSLGKYTFKTIIQHPGDLIIIPPGFWHQTYHAEPSFAVASQHADRLSIQPVFDHILKASSIPNLNPILNCPDARKNTTPQQAVDLLFEHLLQNIDK